MAASSHAILSASSADRWIHCPPSVKLGEGFTDHGSSYAVEGACAHALAEFKLLKGLGREAADPTESLDFFDEEMDEATDGYAAYVLEQVDTAKQSCPDPAVMVEQRVDFSRWVRQGFGTADALIIADGTLHVVDLKYGSGIEVSAEDNPQLKCYALGGLDQFGDLYDIDEVRLTIYQPRRQNVSEWRLPAADLLAWADALLKPAGDLAWDGKGDFACGAWCRFCKAKTICRARAEANLRFAQLDFALPPKLTDDEVETVLRQADDLVAWASDIKEYALTQALAGKQWHGFKLVEERSNRRYGDEKAVASTVEAAGFNPYEERLLGVTAMQKMLGRRRFDELLSGLIVKPQGKPTLVPEADRRPALDTAKQDFQENQEVNDHD